MKKIITIIGTRPQLVKYEKLVPSKLIYLNQHYDKCLIPTKLPKIDYNVKAIKLGQMIDKIILILRRENPDYVIVYGDTRSTLAGAIAANQCNIKVVHIEAGCRSFNNNSIEERNRKIVDDLSSVHFCPSITAHNNLQENRIVKLIDVYNVGATQLDSMCKTFPTKKPKDVNKYYIFTMHRRENLCDISGLKNIIKALVDSREKIEFYIHPHTEKIIKKNDISLKGLKVLKPLNYKSMISRMAWAKGIITDSGGMQVESYFLRRPCITLMDETAWPETVEEKWNVLVGNDYDRLADAIKNFHPSFGAHNTMLYGKGTANKYIKSILKTL